MSKKETILTGYPHVDKPWMQFHDEQLAKLVDPKMNITEYLKSQTVGFEKEIATTYYGNEENYEKFWNKVDNASCVLTELGIKDHDRIMSLVPNIPEAGHLFLGAAQIGAVSDYIDPRPDTMDVSANAKKVLELIDFEKSNHVVALEQCYLGMLRPIENELKDRGINRIITVSASDSMNLFSKISYLLDVIKYNKFKNERDRDTAIRKLKWYQAILEKTKMMKEIDGLYDDAVSKSSLEVVKYSDLLKEIRYSRFSNYYEQDQTIYIAHTSGTSGARPKPITLTNENLICSTEQLYKIDRFYEPGDKILHILPYFSPLGTANNYILNIASGATNIEVPEFEINEIGYLIKKYKPNVFLATPSWLLSLMKCKYLNNMNLSFIKRIVYGGDSMTGDDEKKLNKWLKDQGCNVVVEKGHGMSEYCGCGSYSYSNYNRYDSIGVPLPNTIYGIVNPDIEDYLVPIKFEDGNDFVEGELVVSSDAVTNGVLDDNVIVKHYELDGKSYIRTRDIVKMDRDGLFYFKYRKDRSFTRFDGYKIKPYEIENVVEQSALVKYCRIVPYFDEAMRGLMPKAHVVLEDGVDNADLKSITEQIINEQFVNNPNMSSRQIPTKIKYRDSLPLTKNSKVNFNALKDEGLDGEEVSVVIQETNLAVGNIEIILPNSKVKRR